MKEERVIDRMNMFADWCKNGKLCRSKSDFERICGLTHNYLYNSTINTKSNIGVEQIAKIYSKFPMLNITWVITGKGSMICHEPAEGYREGYEILKKKLVEIQKIANSM